MITTNHRPGMNIPRATFHLLAESARELTGLSRSALSPGVYLGMHAETRHQEQVRYILRKHRFGQLKSPSKTVLLLHASFIIRALVLCFGSSTAFQPFEGSVASEEISLRFLTRRCCCDCILVSITVFSSGLCFDRCAEAVC